ncbi:hypothetical protein TrCOL_g12621 [Triparma columacea]|uniref:GDP-Man:Man(3)GlcNAc(2)-PP-Dol alpha-1,2-mannosyltransferase n=1 Tax=Triparma columacea TaxID=722753 RepID=A0A9W7LFN1_9STRA|nr:hypothetical protein TrCOL_g12621 [Triparma columacea]
MVKLGFYHPFPAGGGGGERVLWKMLEEIENMVSNREINIDSIEVYCAASEEGASKDAPSSILSAVSHKFQITINLPITFIPVPSGRALVSPSSYPSFTMFLQSLGGARFVARALSGRPLPDIFLDTTGCAFTYFPVKLIGFLRGSRIKVFTYTHYPTISTDMLALVYSRRPTYNNSDALASNPLKAYVKLLYYLLFALIYAISGTFADFVMVNSTWTRNHISSLWPLSSPLVLYPPCDAVGFGKSPLTSKKPYIISIGQFRPEKDHALQIRAFKKFKDECRKSRGAKLVLLGGCRGSDDEGRVAELKALVSSLGLEGSVMFLLNEPYSVLKRYLAESSVGIHTMWNEHFGIGVVEMMAAGLITIAHNSGGPKADIIKPGVDGYLADTVETYAEAMKEVFETPEDELLKMRQAARESSMKFDDEQFAKSFRAMFLSNLSQSQKQVIEEVDS